jgi:hypothetical protein
MLLSGGVVSWLQSLCRSVVVAVIAPCVGHRHGLCAMCGVAVAVVVLRGCHGCQHCAMCGAAVAVVVLHGVAGAVVGLRGVVVVVTVVALRVGCGCGLCAACGVVVTVIVPRVGRCHCLCAVWVSRSQSSWWLSLCHMVLQPQSSLSHCHWTTKEEVSRKKKKENVPAGRCGVCSREGTNTWATSTYPTKLFNSFLFIYAILVHECFERPT